MSRTLILTLAAAATISVASFASSSSYAHGGGGGHSGGGGHVSAGGHASAGGHIGGGGHVGGGGRAGGGRVGRNGDRPGHPDRPGRPGREWAFHNHGHWLFRGGRWIIVDPVAGELPDAAPVSGPAPCTCLTKTYTPDGLVVFADACTKETASAPVNGAAADATIKN
jgi:hypothetical protein